MTISAGEERKLLQRAKRLDTAALGQIYDAYSDELFRYAVRLLGNPDLAEECVAETFSRFLNALHQGKGPRKHLRAYLYRVAYNYVADHFRRQQPVAAEDVIEMTPSDALPLPSLIEQSQRRGQIRHALAKLTPEQQQVIVLKFYEGWKNKDIAALLNKPIGAVKSLQHRALGSLHRQLQDAQEVL